MNLQPLIEATIEVARAHPHAAASIVFVLAFGESLAFVSVLLPATVILLALSALIGAAELAFWPLWTAAVVGAILGDWLSYAIGRRYGPTLAGKWPLNRQPQLLERGHAFFVRWGVASAFMGRFFGPLRASVPLVAGMFGMRPLHFQLANITSALVWATLILGPGSMAVPWLMGR